MAPPTLCQCLGSPPPAALWPCPVITVSLADLVWSQVPSQPPCGTVSFATSWVGTGLSQLLLWLVCGCSWVGSTHRYPALPVWAWAGAAMSPRAASNVCLTLPLLPFCPPHAWFCASGSCPPWLSWLPQPPPAWGTEGSCQCAQTDLLLWLARLSPGA